MLLNDRLIFDAPIGQEDTEIERVLHEVCINHRLAVHLENNLDPNLYAGFSVDIEYNRNYEVVKKARRTEDEQEITVRPDILIHKRVGGDIDNDNYLVVEAKKQDIIANDINKIERLILDTRFKYKYGMTISYLRNPDFVECVIFFLNEDGEIETEVLNITK